MKQQQSMKSESARPAARTAVLRLSFERPGALPTALACLALAVCLAPAAKADSSAEELRLTVGKSVVIDYASDIRQVFTSNPEIVDASPTTTREVILNGKGLGTATLIVWNKEGQRYFYNITVEMSLESFRKLLKETFPKDSIQVQSSRDSISLTGTVASLAASDRATAMAAGFAKTVINNLVVNTVVEKQIVLRVRFAELSRTAASQFGVNLVSGAGNQLTSLTTGQIGSPSVTGTISALGSTAALTVSQALNIFAFRPGLNLGALISALESKGILQTLSEPNLVTSNGKEASFIVGGEVPVPVLQGGANASSVTVQFKEYGIRLKFLPTVTTNKTIKMDLMQEVSDIDVAHGVAFNGFVIPALTTRRATTSIELAEHQSFLVAGMLDNRDTESFSKLPGISAVPILGQLFKSRSISKGLDELVMVVTPEITMPMGPGDVKPMPNFPNEFLVPNTPLVPPPAKSAAASASSAKQQAKKASAEAAKDAKKQSQKEVKKDTAARQASAKSGKQAKDLKAKVKKDDPALPKADSVAKGVATN